MQSNSQTHAILLLTASLGKADDDLAKPFSVSEWARFATWLRNHGLQPQDLMRDGTKVLPSDWADRKITLPRIEALLGRGGALALRDLFKKELSYPGGGKRGVMVRDGRLNSGKSRVGTPDVARARILRVSGWAAPQVRSFGCGPEHGIPGQAALCRRRVGEGFAGPSPGQPAPEVGRPGRGPPDCLGLQPRPGNPGHAHWTLRLLAGKVVELMSHEGIATSQVAEEGVAFPRVGTWRMSCLYEEPHFRWSALNTSTQLLAETRPPLPPRPGRGRVPATYSWPVSPWRARHVAVTERRTMKTSPRDALAGG